MTRVLALTKYGRAGPSSRVRTYQFIPQLARAGLDVQVRPLFDDEYVRRLYVDGERSGPAVGRALLRRAGLALSPPAHDVAWIEKEALPYVPALLERALTSRIRPIVLEYDDAIFHLYDQNASTAVRTLLSRKIDSLMRRADLVIAGNRYIADRAQAAGAARVEILPSVVDVGAYQPERLPPASPVVVGWVGTPLTARYLEHVAEPLERLKRAYDVQIRLIGAGSAALPSLGVERAPWTETGEAEAIAELDIGIMPLTDTPWERGKCGYKLIQYMAAGVPVVASPVGANNDIVLHGETGFLAGSHEEWFSALERLVASPNLRRGIGAAGRRRAEACYSTDSAGPRLAALLRDVAESGRHSRSGRAQ